jgi:hypothetical protein
MRWFHKASPPVAEPQPTPDDYLAEADIALKVARQEYADACLQVSQFKVRHPEYVQVGNAIVRQFFPDNHEWRSATRRESRAHEAMRAAMERRVDLLKLYRPEIQFVGGVKVTQ